MDVFTTISDPTRRRMLELLRVGELPAGEFVRAFPSVTQPAVSRHLRLLHEAGLVSRRAVEQRRIYALRRDGFEPVEQWLAAFRPFWPERLDALEAHLAASAADFAPPPRAASVLPTTTQS